MLGDGFVPVKGFESGFEIHPDGRVRRLQASHISPAGSYVSPGQRALYVSKLVDGKRVGRVVSRWILVEETFGPGVAPPTRYGFRDRSGRMHAPVPNPDPKRCWAWPRIKEMLSDGPACIGDLAADLYGDRSLDSRQAASLLMMFLSRKDDHYTGGPYVVRVSRGWYALATEAKAWMEPAQVVRNAITYRPRTVADLEALAGVGPHRIKIILRDIRLHSRCTFHQAVAPRSRWERPDKYRRWYWLGTKAMERELADPLDETKLASLRNRPKKRGVPDARA